VLVALVLSLVLNLVGGVVYLQRRAARKPRADIYRIDRMDQLQHLASTSRADVVLVGDSLTDHGEWRELLANIDVANRGIAGDTIAGVTSRLGAVLALQPKTVAVMVGINDLLSGTSAATCLERHAALLAALKRGNPAPRVLLQSILPVGRAVGLSNDVIRSLNDQLRTLCSANGCEFVDLFPAFVVDGALDPTLTTDGVHLNGRGYERWAESLRAALARES
jgi:lysophospholipase L1-like esterase